MDKFQYFQNLANENGKFALEVGYQFDQESGLQQELEAAQLSGKVTLIDITPLDISRGSPGKLYRVFKING